MGLARYLGRKLIWTIIVFFVALLLNFLLPRLIPGNPVDVIVGTLARGGGASGEDLEKIHAHYMAEFGLDKPMWQQFFIYCNNVLHGNLGTSFSQYPASVNSLIGQALPWSLALMIPAVLIGWVVGNTLGAVAAYRGGWVDRGGFVGPLPLQRPAVRPRHHPAVPGRGEDADPSDRWCVLLRALPRADPGVLR